ncbi:MAG: hypothetical protein JW929_03375 [Anaerolineales bacterium]|nr:hypothetical protein [Anaerolineales bacterium]
MRPSTAILVVSCDSYRDVWIPFFTLFFRYWEDCPYPVFLGSNFEGYPDKRVVALSVGEDRDWSSNLHRMLEGIPAEGILLLQEDFLFDRPIHTGRIESYIEYARSRRAACLRLMPIPGPDEGCADQPDLGEIRKGAEYRVSLQAAWWRKECLAAVARDGESPWQFERLGSRRSDSIDAAFLSLREGVDLPLDYFTTAVVRGCWEPGAVELCRRENVPVDLRTRKILPFGYRWERALRRMGVPDRMARILGLPFRIGGPARKRDHPGARIPD